MEAPSTGRERRIMHVMAERITQRRIQGLAVPNLRRVRRLRFLTQADLARRIGTTQQVVQRWETGKANPRPSSMKKLCDALEVTPTDLVGTGAEPRDP